ncbi:Bca.t1.c1 [Apiospora arundinis]
MSPAPLDVCLDIFGQQPRHSRLYTPICFGFTFDEDVDKESIAPFLQNGFDRLVCGFPWLAGQVVQDGAGIYRIRHCDGKGGTPQLTVKDLRQQQTPSAVVAEYLSTGSSGIRASLLDEATLAPCGTFHHPITATTSGEPAAVPVFQLQANLVRGGLLLVANGLHSCMDLAGQAQMLRLLAKACRGEPFSAEDLAMGNMPRRDILQPLVGLSDAELLRKPVNESTPERENDDEGPTVAADSATKDEVQSHSRNPSPTATSAASLRWSTFIFPASSLQALKAKASEVIAMMGEREEGEEEQSTPSFISTDDALTALLWRSITRSRVPRLSSAASGPSTMLTRTVDARAYVAGLPRTYPGDAAFKVTSASSVASLLDQPLGVIAAELRARLRPDEVRDGIRAHVTKITARGKAGMVKGGDVGGSSSVGNLNPSAGVNLSSWAKEPCYDFDFGGSSSGTDLRLGQPTLVQRPVFIDKACESLVYFMPKRPNGDIAVLVCLCEEDMERMQKEEELGRYGRYVE